MTAHLLKTPLHDAHARRGARIVDFHGWLMPLQYTGILEEHAAVRSRAGAFDVSHMGRVRVRGSGRKAFLQKLLTIDVDKVPPGRCRYSFFLNEKGGVIDDLILSAGTDDDLLVVNASNRETDLAWMNARLFGDVSIEDQTFAVAMVAVQGPGAPAAVRAALGADPGGLAYYTHGIFGGFPVSRTGYTGEDGFEILVPSDRVESVWERILAEGVAPVGLGARDTLRTEAAMPLHGHEIDETIHPLEAGLGFAVEMNKPDFIGRDVLKAVGPPTRRRVGLTLESRRIPRPGHEVYLEGKRVGAVTSGTFSPSLDRPIALAWMPRDAAPPGTEVEIDIRGRREKAGVVKLPFYRRRQGTFR